MKKYDSYKNSGVEWIGEIPSHWKAVPMRFLLRQRITDGPHETPKFLPDGIPFLSVDGIQDGELVFEGCRKISIEDHERYKQKCVVEKHDILMGKAASVGKVAQVKVDFEFSIWSPLALLKPNHEKITSSYFEYFLKSTYAKDNANILSTFNTQQNISMTDIPRIYYIIPNSVEEQTAIAAYLDRKTAEIDELIADKKRLLQLYEEEKTAIINQAVTKGINPDAPMKDSGIEWLGEIPEHWETVSLKWVSKIYSGGTPSKNNEDFWQNGTIPWLNSGTVNQFFITEPSEFITEEALNSSSAKWIPEHSIVIALAGQGKTKGMAAQVMFECTCNQSMGVIVPNDIIVNRFLLYYLTRNYQNIRNLGGGDKRDGINLEMVGGIPLPVIPLPEQAEIVRHIEDHSNLIDAKKAKTEKLIELLTEYRTALISEVVTGKIKVTD